MNVPSLQLTCPILSSPKKQDAPYSATCRLTSVAMGVIMGTIGMLILFKVSGLSSLGTSLGYGFCGTGIALCLTGAFLKCVENRKSKRLSDPVIPKESSKNQTASTNVLTSSQKTAEEVKPIVPIESIKGVTPIVPIESIKGVKPLVSITFEETRVVFTQNERVVYLDMTRDSWSQVYSGLTTLSLHLPQNGIWNEIATLPNDKFLNFKLERIIEDADPLTLKLISYRLQNYDLNLLTEPVVPDTIGALLDAIQKNQWDRITQDSVLFGHGVNELLRNVEVITGLLTYDQANRAFAASGANCIMYKFFNREIIPEAHRAPWIRG